MHLSASLLRFRGQRRVHHALCKLFGVLALVSSSQGAGSSSNGQGLGFTEFGSAEWYVTAQSKVNPDWRFPRADTDAANAQLLQSISPEEREAVIERCALTRGSWCYAFHAQTPVPWKPPPQGDRECPGGCNGVGRCNYDTGVCLCTAGWTGDDCRERQDRRCQKSPSTWAQWTRFARLPGLCEGYCDTNVGFCFCNGTHGRVEDMKGVPFTAAPGGVGRPLSWHMQPGKSLPDRSGRVQRLYAGARPYSLWGPQGWCEAEQPAKNPPCHLESFGGSTCERAVETTCVNQCSGHGDCHLGFCKCHAQWYGDDCSRLRKGAEPTASLALSRPWVKRHVRTPVLDQSLAGIPRTRRRPLIYVYDMDTLFTSKMLQWRHIKEACVSRYYDRHNGTYQIFSSYMLEFALHEMILQSEHLTHDPKEADFFFIPLYESCFAWPIHGFTEFPYFFESGVSNGPGMGYTDGRTVNGMYMYLAGLKWIREHFPYWDRNGGSDHIIMATHDEGSCWLPNEMRAAVVLTHWAPLDFPRKSNSAWPADLYSFKWGTRNASQYTPGEHLQHLFGEPCFNPAKDVCITGYKPAYTYVQSPMLGQPALKRDILLFLRGDVGKKRYKHYSNGVRQGFYQHSQEGKWAQRFNIRIGDSTDVHGKYSELLSRSIFCLIATGDGFSMRAEDALLHGCIPLVVMDNILPIMDPHLDWDAFSVRIAESDIARTPEILQSIARSGQLEVLQRNVERVWHRFSYSSYYPFDRDIASMRAHGKQTWQKNGSPEHVSIPAPAWGPVDVDDGFATLMQVLYGKCKARQQDTGGREETS